MLLWWGRPVNENARSGCSGPLFLRRCVVLRAVPGPGAGPGKGEVGIHQRRFHGSKTNPSERYGQPGGWIVLASNETHHCPVAGPEVGWRPIMLYPGW